MFNYSYSIKNQNTTKKVKFLTVYQQFLEKKNKKLTLSENTKRQISVMYNTFSNYLISIEKEEIDIENVDEDFLTLFFLHLKQTLKPTSTYHKNMYYEISAVFTFAIKNKLTKENPCNDIEINIAEKKQLLYLTDSQLNYLAFVKLNPYMRTVVDLFLIQCYTGFAFSDLIKYNHRLHFVSEPKGYDKIIINRTKSKVTCIIPVLPRVSAILRKYNNILPTKKYDYYLAMLDVVGGILNLPFKLTTHIGRKTAGVYLLNEGVSIEVVSKVLGHSSIKTTEKTYATILTKRIDREFDVFYKK
jgi:site-specific recombinase XerD